MWTRLCGYTTSSLLWRRVSSVTLQLDTKYRRTNQFQQKKSNMFASTKTEGDQSPLGTEKEELFFEYSTH